MAGMVEKGGTILELLLVSFALRTEMFVDDFLCVALGCRLEDLVRWIVVVQGW